MVGIEQWMEATGAPAVSSDAEGSGARAALSAGPLAYEPAVLHAEHFLARLSGTCMIGL